MAMQGLAVVPLFAGYDLARGTGPHLHLRRDRRPLRGDRHNATGSGGRDARTTIKLGYRMGMARDDAVELAVEALYEAADEDSATGGPDLIRGIYPMVATVTGRGLRGGARRRGGRAVRRRCIERRRVGGAPAMTMPYYVAPEQVMKDRAEYAQKGIARGRSLVATTYDQGIAHRGREPVPVAAQDQRDLRPHRLRRCGQVQRVRPAAGVRHPPRRHQGLRLQPRGRRRPVAGQPLRPVPRAGLHPRDEAPRGGDPGGRAGHRAAPADQLYHIAYEGTITDEDRYAVLGGETETIAATAGGGVDRGLGPGRGPAGRGGRPGRSGPDPDRHRPRGGRPGPGERPTGLPPAGRRGAAPPCWAEPFGPPGAVDRRVRRTGPSLTVP